MGLLGEIARTGHQGVGPADAELMRRIVRHALPSNPRVAGPAAFGVPADRQIRQFDEAWVIVDRVMKTGNHRATSVGHGVSEKLPRAIFGIVGNVHDVFGAVVNCLRKKSACVWRIGEFPAEETALWVCWKPKNPALLASSELLAALAVARTQHQVLRLPENDSRGRDRPPAAPETLGHRNTRPPSSLDVIPTLGPQDGTRTQRYLQGRGVCHG